MGREIVEEALRFRAGPLLLEGVLAYPEDRAPRDALLLLAPHPHLGGRMDNNLIRHLARRGAEDGRATLRFNYRGVGGSEIDLPAGTGTFDHFAAMEREQRYQELLPDGLAAYQALMATAGHPPRRIVVGYSLGAVLAGMLGARVDATHLVGISPPVPRVSLEAWLDCPQPKLFVGGDQDFAFEIGPFEEQLERLPGSRRFERLEGGDHFFRKQEEHVHRMLGRWLEADEGALWAGQPRSATPPQDQRPTDPPPHPPGARGPRGSRRRSRGSEPR